MNRRNRTAMDKLDATGKEISVIMTWYLDGEIWVNKKYQRKLVWSLNDKKDFIDSILDNILTPSMMMCWYEEDGVGKFEIIDGLQRMNAIMSFIFNEFPVIYDGQECYFDLSTHHLTYALLRSNKVQQKSPVLPEKVCRKFLSYQLLLAITQQDDEKVEKTFLRINSSGKKLSAQDLRQSSSCDSFADLVRRVSCYARGEFSFDDTVNLMDIPKISMDGPGLPYGVHAANTFWRRHNIITYESLKQSRDEELVAKIIGELLLNDVSNPSSDMLNKMYINDNKYNTQLNNVINTVGMNIIEEKFRNTFSIINNIFSEKEHGFSSCVFSDARAKNKNDCFRIFFIALYKLLCEGFVVEDYGKLAKSLKGFADSSMHAIIAGSYVGKEEWITISDSVYGFLKQQLTRHVSHTATDVEKEIKHRLMLSSVESAMTEFKAGISIFNTGTKDQMTISRIAKTLTAMANTESSEKGLVIIGIANDRNAMNDWEKVYNQKALEYDNHYVLGVNAEASRYYHGVDNYLREVSRSLQKEPIDSELKEYILQNISEVDFYDKSLVILRSKRLSHCAFYDDKLYIRHGSNTCEISKDSEEFEIIQENINKNK